MDSKLNFNYYVWNPMLGSICRQRGNMQDNFQTVIYVVAVTQVEAGSKTVGGHLPRKLIAN